MSFDWPAPIVNAYERARTSEAPLGERLRIVADVVASQYPAFTAIVESFVRRLELAKAGVSAPGVGDRLPPFLLPDDGGRLISLDELLGRGPALIAFHRGHWCPYCQL